MMQWDFRISSDIRLVLKLPDQFNIGILRSILPEMVSAVYQKPRSLSEIVSSSGNSMTVAGSGGASGLPPCRY